MLSEQMEGIGKISVSGSQLCRSLKLSERPHRFSFFFSVSFVLYVL